MKTLPMSNEDLTLLLEMKIPLLNCYKCCQQGLLLVGEALFYLVKQRCPEILPALPQDMNPYGTVYRVTHKEHEKVYVAIKRFAQAKTAIEVLIFFAQRICDNLINALELDNKDPMIMIATAPISESSLIDYGAMLIYVDNIRDVFTTGVQKSESAMPDKEAEMVRTVDNTLYNLSCALSFCRFKDK